MKIVIAPDSFKGSLSTMGVADAIERGILEVLPQAETVKIPVADGGEGLLEAVQAAAGGELISVPVMGPLGEERKAPFLLLPDKTAVVEMAQASGLPLVPKEKRDPRLTTTYGTGQLIRAALDCGAKKIMIGLGGSATNDGGAGMAQALGAALLDENGEELPVGGGALAHLRQVELSKLDRRLEQVSVVAACDITNPLCGDKGATAVYGPQKGATPELVPFLDGCLLKYAGLVEQATGKQVRDVPGAGAAGGLGAGLMAFCGASLQPGIELVLDLAQMDRHLEQADLVITGEGRADFQSAYGKVPDGVAKRAGKYGVPVAVLAGSIGKGAEELYQKGVGCISSIQQGPISLEECMERAPELLASAANRLLRTLLTGMEMKKY